MSVVLAVVALVSLGRSRAVAGVTTLLWAALIVLAHPPTPLVALAATIA